MSFEYKSKQETLKLVFIYIFTKNLIFLELIIIIINTLILKLLFQKN